MLCDDHDDDCDEDDNDMMLAYFQTLKCDEAGEHLQQFMPVV